MIDIATITILLIAFVAEAYIVIKLKGQSGVLVTALILIINVILFVALHFSYNKITDPADLTNMNSHNYLIDFNLYTAKVRNSVILIGLLALAYGLYHQYDIKSNKVFLISSFILGGITILWLVMALIAGAFII